MSETPLPPVVKRIGRTDMRAEYLRFGLAGVFAALAAVLFLRHELIPNVDRWFQEVNLALGSWLALVLAGWNAARGYLERSNRRLRMARLQTPLRKEPESVEPYVRNPDLDFLKLPDEQPLPKPSANGDHKG